MSRRARVDMVRDLDFRGQEAIADVEYVILSRVLQEYDQRLVQTGQRQSRVRLRH